MKGVYLARLTYVSVMLFGLSFATAQDFFGFEPKTYNGEMLSADTLQQMVSAAKEVTPPKNGKNYVFAFANLQRDIAFGILTEQGIVKNAEAAGIELVIADNRLDGPTALSNAQSFVQRNVDFVIEFQTDANFGSVIMEGFNNADTPVIAIDIPMEGATFFGANNPRSGFMGGSYLVQAAQAKFGDRLNDGYLVIGALPQSGAIPALRTGGQRAGFLASDEGFPEDHIIEIDTKNTLEESFSQMSNALGRIPEGVPVMGIAINDQATTGMLRAVQTAGREADALFVGMGADELDTLTGEPEFIASPGYFPERYGNYLVPTALATLAGREVPAAVLVNHVMVTPMNVCEYYEDRECKTPEGYPDFTYEFPQDAYQAHLESVRANPDYAGYEAIIPAE